MGNLRTMGAVVHLNALKVFPITNCPYHGVKVICFGKSVLAETCELLIACAENILQQKQKKFAELGSCTTLLIRLDKLFSKLYFPLTIVFKINKYPSSFLMHILCTTGSLHCSIFRVFS